MGMPCFHLRLTLGVALGVFPVLAHGTDVLACAGEHGLWRLAFEDGKTLSAADFATNAVAGGSFSSAAVPGGERLFWTAPAADVQVDVRRPDARTTDLRAVVTVREGTAVELQLPARIRFDAADVKRFVYPGVCLFGPGMAFNGKFYRRRHVIDIKYPTLCADFAQLETVSGERLAVYGIRRRPPHEPWENPVPFVPGRTATGGDRKGGWFEHAFVLYARDGVAWQSPVTRLRREDTLEEALGDYAAENGLTRTLADKVRDPVLLEKLLHAPLCNVNDLTARTMPAARRALADWPRPSLFHFTGYLKGGFDKEYPDHLPPNPAFGTLETLREIIAFARARGHVVCPYTNPTWWCDDPRGPTFEKWGEAPLARKKDGTFYRESYAGCSGYVQTYAHPGSKEGNRRTVRQFSRACPVDLLFQDQCGSRDWIWNFNPVLPSPTLQTEGMISMGEEDSAVIPLATEDGWDGLANAQTAFMGCTRRIVPYEKRPAWAKLYKQIYPPDTWTLEPVLLRLLHGKVLFYQHNLGQFTIDERILAWSLALGYQLSYGAPARDWTEDDSVREWYRFLHLLQDKVVSRLADKPLTAFTHDRTPLFETGGDPMRTADDGVVTARFGDVVTAVNLGDVPRFVAGKRLAAYGWDVSAPGLHAYFHEGRPPTVKAEGRVWTFEARQPPVRPVCLSPAARGVKNRVGVLDIPGLVPWGGAGMPAEWRRALASSSCLAERGFSVEALTEVPALKAALSAPDEWFAILNPYGEAFPEASPGDWTNVLNAVRSYLEAGGNWIETGGLSWVAAVRPGHGRPEHTFVPGLRRLGLCSGAYPSTKEPETPLRPSISHDKVFSDDLRRALAETRCRVNRPLPESVRYPLDVFVEDTAGRPWMGAYRFDGGGALWRFGMIHPPKKPAIRATAEMLAYCWTRTLPVPPVRVRHLTER